MSHPAIQYGSPVGRPGCDTSALNTSSAAALPNQPEGTPDEVQAWLDSLPMPLQGRSMARIAPGMTRQIAAVWSDLSLTSRLLEQLLRGEGVPSQAPEVADKLLCLYEYHERCRAHDAPDTTWELPVSRLHSLSSDTAAGARP